MERRCRYHKRLRCELQAGLDVERSMKCGVRMRAIWCVRVGLSPAHIPQRPIAEFLSEFPATPGVSTIGQCYIGRARDAFVAVLKEFGTLALEKVCFGQEYESRERGGVGRAQIF